MIVNGKAQWIPQLKQLWIEAFGDDEAFIELFYQYHFREENVWCYQVGEEPVAVLYGIEGAYWLDETGTKTCPIQYYYAGATRKSCRGKGYYGELLAYLRQRKEGIATLVPVHELLPYYIRNRFHLNVKEEEEIIPHKTLMELQEENVEVLKGTLSGKRYKELRDAKLGCPGYIEWDENAINFAIENNLYTKGIVKEVRVDTEPHLLMAKIMGKTLRIIETTLSKQQLYRYGAKLVEEFECNDIVIKGKSMMSVKDHWPYPPYFNLILDE